MKFRDYLTEGKKFKTTYKKGDKIEVQAERRPIYAHPGYVESGKVTKMTIIIDEPAEKRGTAIGSYLVKIKGKFTKIPQTGGKIPKGMRFDILQPNFGTLSTSFPKPMRYEVYP
jgi:hypothetical protein